VFASAGDRLEGSLDPFLGEPEFEIQQVFEGGRFPNVTVATDGSVLAVFGKDGVRLRRSEDGGRTWGAEITIAEPGFMGGGVTADEGSGDVLAFIEKAHPPAPLKIYRSKDHGKTWQPQAETVVKPDSQGHTPSMHMNEHGITLRHGKEKGRLVRPSRWYGKKNAREEWPTHYTNAIFSDDGGKTWQASEPFPELGTGEACIAELSDGTLYYNSRVHWDERPNFTKRREARSNDAGATWGEFRIIEILPDGQQNRSYGCMGGLARLPVAGRDILLFSNIETPNARRENGTVWASFDGGETWPVKRLANPGPSGYSSMDAGRPGTPSEGWIYLMPEAGGAKIARFNLSWVAAGEATGDGEIPDWARPSDR
jgi:sialidase-1